MRVDIPFAVAMMMIMMMNIWMGLLLCSETLAFSSSISLSRLQQQKQQGQRWQQQECRMATNHREEEIRKKIMKLKKQGKIQKKQQSIEEEDEMNDEQQQQQQPKKIDLTADNPYADKIRSKLGKKVTMLPALKNLVSSLDEDDEDDDEDITNSNNNNDDDKNEDIQNEPTSSSSSVVMTPRLGSLTQDPNFVPEEDYNLDNNNDDDSTESMTKELQQEIQDAVSMIRRNEQIDDDDDDEDDALSEEDLIQLVAAKLEQQQKEEEEEEEEEKDEQSTTLSSSDLTTTTTTTTASDNATKDSDSSSLNKQTTSGVGGSWSKNNTAQTDTYKPSRGSWGYFPRPKDISKAYGGGKRVGAGVQTTADDEKRKRESVQRTKDRLQQYREKVGIDVQSEKDHADEIQSALDLARRAMERGLYDTAVSALEKVTRFCSTNSQVGGQVFLELAMSYEAVGRTSEAITVYSTLSNSRNDEIKFNAQRLLNGIEALQVMRSVTTTSGAFSRKQVQKTFIETTGGLANIAENFDDKYNTAWIDMDGDFYKKLSENVVRSIREARQILLQATGSGEVNRMRVIQALRSMSRYFDDALEEEKKEQQQEQKEQAEPVAMMNGKPIRPRSSSTTIKKKKSAAGGGSDLERFLLASPNQMKENLQGQWKLQLMADKRGDGVRYYNTTLSWQTIQSSSSSTSSTTDKNIEKKKEEEEVITFQSSSSGFTTLERSGTLEFDNNNRIVQPKNVSSSSSAGGVGAWFSQVVMNNQQSTSATFASPKQIISVDSILLITRQAKQQQYDDDGRKKKNDDDIIKDYFCVWRRVPSGTYSSSSSSL